MDFVVAGLGFGALIIVVGFIVRDVGPLLWRKVGSESGLGERRSVGQWHALCHGISTAMTAGGAIIVLATVAAVLLGLSDSAGAIVVLIASVAGVVAAVLLGVRTAQAYRRGVIRPVPVREPVESPQRIELSGLSKQSTGPLPVMQRRADQAGDPVNAPDLVLSNSSPETEDGSFDVHTLLPGEVHHADDHSLNGSLPPVAPLPAIEDVVQEPDATGRDGAEDDVEFEPPLPVTVHDEAENEVEPVVGEVPIAETSSLAEETSSAETESEVEKPVDEEPTGADDEHEHEPEAPADRMGPFQSPLLADISADEDERPFSSRLLADVDPDAAPESSTYRSPVLADLNARDDEERDEPVHSKRSGRTRR